jgi:uncharacterized repeat protein (TIGR04076 family)
MNSSMEYCSRTAPFTICQHFEKKKCGYCKTGKEAYNEKNTVTGGFCVDAFYSVYPILLSLLYDGTFDPDLFGNELIIKCPNANHPARIKIGFVNKKLKIVFNLIEKVFRYIGFPKDAIDKMITLEVLSKGEPCILTTGQKKTIKIPDIKELCPASFYSFYPMLYYYCKDASFDTDKLRFVCPDPKTNLIYTPSSSVKNKNASFFCVPSVSKYHFSQIEMNPRNPAGLTVDKMLPEGICPCLFNIAIPYILTFAQGGHFKWSKDINSVHVQCPDAEARVNFEVRKEEGNAVSIHIHQAQGHCLNKHEKGQKYHFDCSNMASLYLFSRIFPFILMLEQEREKNKFPEGIAIISPLDTDKNSYLLSKDT